MTRNQPQTNRRKPKARNTRVKPSTQTTPGWLWMLGGVLIGVLVMAVANRDGDKADNAANKKNDVAVVEKDKPADLDHKPRFDFYTLLKESEVVIPDENGNLPAAKPVVIPEPDKKPATMEPDAKTVKQPPTAVESPKTVAAEPTKEAEPAEKAKPIASAEPASAQSKSTEVAPAKATATTPVAVKVPPKPAPVDASKPLAEREVYVLQAGSFRAASDADSVRASLLLLNMHANIEKVVTGSNETWHRVVVGPFTSKEELSRARATLTQNGIDSIQVKRRL